MERAILKKNTPTSHQGSGAHAVTRLTVASLSTRKFECYEFRQVFWLPVYRLTRLPSLPASDIQRAPTRLQRRARDGFSPSSLKRPKQKGLRSSPEFIGYVEQIYRLQGPIVNPVGKKKAMTT